MSKKERAKPKYKVEILALDEEGNDILYFANEMNIEGTFIKFTPKKCSAKTKFYDMAEMIIMLPNTRVKRIIIRET